MRYAYRSPIVVVPIYLRRTAQIGIFVNIQRS